MAPVLPWGRLWHPHRSCDFLDLRGSGVGGRLEHSEPGKGQPEQGREERGQLGGRRVAGRSPGDGSLAGRTPLLRPGVGPTAGGAEGSEAAGALPRAGRTPPGGAPASLGIRRRRDRPLPPPRRTKLEAGTRGRKPRAGVPALPDGGAPGAALTMSYTLSTTNWLAPILFPAAAASSSSRSVSTGRRPLPHPRAPQAGLEPGTKRPARPATAGAEASGSRGRSREPLTGTCARTGPDRWRARSGSGASPWPQTRGGRRSLGGGRAPGTLEAGPARSQG